MLLFPPRQTTPQQGTERRPSFRGLPSGLLPGFGRRHLRGARILHISPRV